MEISVLALEAVNIVLSTLDKATGGALEKAGADVFDFLKARFNGRFEFKQVEKERDILKAAIVSEANRDKRFQEDLERLSKSAGKFITM